MDLEVPFRQWAADPPRLVCGGLRGGGAHAAGGGAAAGDGGAAGAGGGDRSAAGGQPAGGW